MDDLYQEVLLDHVKHPKRQGTLPEASQHIELHNPLCGDEVEFWFETADGKVSKVRFQARGCFISRASASLVCDLIEGRPIQEALELGRAFRRAIFNQELTADEREKLGELVALEGVKQYPTRVKCAMLAFEALEKGLNAKV